MGEREQLQKKTAIEFAKELTGKVEDIDLAQDMAFAQKSNEENAIAAGKAKQLHVSIMSDSRYDSQTPYRLAAELKAGIENGDAELAVDTPEAVELTELYKAQNPWQKELASRTLGLASEQDISQRILEEVEVVNVVGAIQQGQKAAYIWAKNEKSKSN